MGTLLGQLNPVYFWDVYSAALDEQASKRLIITRVFERGSLHEIRLIHDFYGRDTIIATLTRQTYIDPKTHNFVSVIYGVPKSKFKCYRRKRSMQGFWG